MKFTKKFTSKNIDEIIQRTKSFIVMNSIVKNLNDSFSELVNEITFICNLPAPTFQETQRSQYINQRLEDLDLNPVIDDIGNVIVRYPGNQRIAKLVICSHLDTVFGFDLYPLNIESKNDKISAPGIGDNSTSVAVLFFIIQTWKYSNYVPPFDVFFLWNTCEEGLGDLKGIKTFLENLSFKKEIDLLDGVISLDGTYPHVSISGIWSRRIKVTFQTSGGHSWTNFGSASAIHTLGRCIAEISKINIPRKPRTTYNIGIVEGGTGINVIAESSSMHIDLRSIDQKTLINLENEVRSIVSTQSQTLNTKYKITVVGDRSGGTIEEGKDHPFVKLVLASARAFELEVETGAASTDSNIPLSLGIPAFTIGCYRGENAHRVTEYIIPSSLKKGVLFVSLSLLSIIELISLKSTN